MAAIEIDENKIQYTDGVIHQASTKGFTSLLSSNTQSYIALGSLSVYQVIAAKEITSITL